MILQDKTTNKNKIKNILTVVWVASVFTFFILICVNWDTVQFYIRIHFVSFLNILIKYKVTSILFFSPNWIKHYIPIGIAVLIFILSMLWVIRHFMKKRIGKLGNKKRKFIRISYTIAYGVSFMCLFILVANMVTAAHSKKVFMQIYNEPLVSYLKKDAYQQKNNQQKIREYVQKEDLSLDNIIELVSNNPTFMQSISQQDCLIFSQIVCYLVNEQGNVQNTQQHYFRNFMEKSPETLDEMVQMILNKKDNVFGWRLVPVNSTLYHMNGTDGEYNLKFISLDGHFEAVYNKNGEKLTFKNDSQNMGTYNYADSVTELGKHAKYDVAPYLKWGNVQNEQAVDSDIVTLAKEKYKNNLQAQNYREKYEQLLR